MKPIVPIVLKSTRLILRPPLPEDAARIECFISDRRVAEMTALIPHPYPRGGCVDWIRLTEQQWLEGVKASFVICLRDSGDLVGAISFFCDGSRDNEIGYWIGVPHWGRGYATEALERVLRYAFDELEVQRVDTYHFAHNPASGRVMEKAGLKFLSKTKLGASRGDEQYDDVRYGLSAGEWRARHASMAK
ncbi:GNAT family N-acetyltransferase [Haloferula sp. BvORR071]|uniref:GNAT family N-acetyltransferase n=1 Tax=Haloferula sp. BvORR071 TaxID=1396141 RepID=UPI0006979BEF|nr:GNAT family N-acetyltransferase [Haloferula sp. BvORR071]